MSWVQILELMVFHSESMCLYIYMISLYKVLYERLPTKEKFTSLPAIQWKKYSWGFIPVKNRPSTNPPALGLVSYGINDGRDRPVHIMAYENERSLIKTNIILKIENYVEN